MDRPRRAIGAELFAVALIAGCTASTLAALVTAHRRGASRPRPELPPAVVASGPAVVAATLAAVAVEPPPAPPAVDPTPPILARLAAAEADQRQEADRVRGRAAALDAAARSARAESERWKRTSTLALGQIQARRTEALRVESKAELAALERDALARRRDSLKKALDRDRARPAYAVLPHKGPNGTWQRPIVLECREGGVALRPNGPGFDLDDLSLSYRGGSSPFVASISREAVRIQRQAGPDGLDITPYIFFIVRPDGIRSYYEARTRLERLGIAFGYELADADWAIDVPDLDQVSTWDGSAPPLGLDDPATPAPADAIRPGESAESGHTASDNPFVWPRSPGESDGDGTGRGGTGTGWSGIPGHGNRGVDLPDAVVGTGSGLAGEGRDDRPGRGLASPGSPSGPRTGSGLPEVGGSPGPAGTPSGGARTDDLRLGGKAVWDRALRADDPGRPVGLDPSPPADPGSAATIPSGNSRVRGGGSIPPGRVGQGPGREPARGLGGDRAGDGPGERASRGAGPSPGAPGSEGEATGVGRESGDGTGSGPSGGGGPGRVSKPIELVLACGPKGVVVHPGDYRVTVAMLRSKDPFLTAQLRAILRQREQATPGVSLDPSVRFVIEPGGRETYATARGQLAISGIDWPTTVNVSGGDILRLFSTDNW